MFKLVFIAVVVIAHVSASPCLLSDNDLSCCTSSQPYYHAEASAAPASVSYVCEPSYFNPKLLLYKKFPLLYKLYAHRANLYCKKINGLNVGPPVPKAVACAIPKVVAAPAPVYVTPAPLHVAECPAPALTPEVINTLVTFSRASAPAPLLEPALSCGCGCS